MKVLVVYAHFNPDSFTHAILEQVTKGLDDGGHDYKVNDLYAIGFDPVFTPRGRAQFLHESLPEELLEEANPGEAVLAWRAARSAATWPGAGCAARTTRTSPRRSRSTSQRTCANSRRWSPRPRA